MVKIDKQQIDQLIFIEATSGEKIINHLLDLYIQQMSKYGPLIIAEADKNNLLQVSSMAHSLKSSAANLGMLSVEQICLFIETEGKKNHQLNYAELVQQIHDESELALEQIKAFLAEQK